MNLNENIYNQNLSCDQPKFKLWSAAGLMLTYKCNCACEFCYYRCEPNKNGLMTVEDALAVWRALKILTGERAKIHLTGGEPFLYFEQLEQILTEAKKQNLGPVDLIETNAFWATNGKIAREKISRLAELGLNKLKISCDLFHQRYVDIQPVLILAQAAGEILGKERVLVRWEKYLQNPVEMKNIPPEKLRENYLACLRDYPCRFAGRAADSLAQMVADKSIETLLSRNCSNSFLGAKSVHIDPYGNVFSGTCSGIILGNIRKQPLEKIWRNFHPSNNELIGKLFTDGPCGLLENAMQAGYAALPAYADKCHLCSDLRQFFFTKGMFSGTIGPAECYIENQ